MSSWISRTGAWGAAVPLGTAFVPSYGGLYPVSAGVTGLHCCCWHACVAVFVLAASLVSVPGYVGRRVFLPVPQRHHQRRVDCWVGVLGAEPIRYLVARAPRVRMPRCQVW